MWLTIAWLEQTEEPLAEAPGFIPTTCTGSFETYSFRRTRWGLGSSPKAMCLTLFVDWMGEEWENM